jgi:hypothetical protein
VRQWTVYGVNAKRWARRAGLAFLTSTCKKCKTIQVLDIPFVFDEMRGLRAAPCACIPEAPASTGGGLVFTIGFAIFDVGKAPKRKRSRRKCRVFQFPPPAAQEAQ